MHALHKAMFKKRKSQKRLGISAPVAGAFSYLALTHVWQERGALVRAVRTSSPTGSGWDTGSLNRARAIDPAPLSSGGRRSGFHLHEAKM